MAVKRRMETKRRHPTGIEQPMTELFYILLNNGNFTCSHVSEGASCFCAI